MCTSFQAKFKVLDKIGEGSFSEVLKCQDRNTGVLYAAKRLKKIYQNINEILESPEVTAMRKITHHPNVLYMIESHYDPLPGKVTLIFELMEMSLYDLMRNRQGRLLLEIRVKNYIYQLLKGLHHLHKHGIFHRDIKPENILLKAGHVKIGDLGSIRGIYSRPPYTEYISTRWYRSPECLLTSGFYGPKMDVWAVGCVFFELLALEPLFPGENEVDQVSKIHSILGTPHARLVAKFRRISSRTRNGDFYFPAKQGRGLACLLPQISSLGLETLRTMLIYDPENRASTKKLLEHRYFADIRERESTRQTRSALLSNSLMNDSKSWKEPLILGYLSSERHCRLRLVNGRQSHKSMNGNQSQPHFVDSSKTPRSLESTPCNGNSATLKKYGRECHESKIPQFAGLEHLKHTQVGQYFLKKRQSLQDNRMNSRSKKWYDSNRKLTSLRFSDKKKQQNENNATRSSIKKSSNIYQNFFVNEELKSQKRQGEKHVTDKLPSIYLQRNRNNNYHANSSMYVLSNNCKIRSTTTRERPTQGLSPRKPSAYIRSPMTKITKREANDYHFHSTSFDSSRLSLRKSYEQKFKYNAN